MLPLWGSSGAAPPLLFPFTFFFIFSHLLLSLTNFQESLLHHLFQLISCPWSAQKFQLFFTFSPSSVNSFHSFSLFSLSLQSQVFAPPFVLHRKFLSGHILGPSKKPIWATRWLWFKATVSYVIHNFFKSGGENQDPQIPFTRTLRCWAVPPHVNAQSCSSRTRSVGQRGLMNCWDNSSLLYFSNWFRICDASF